MGFKTSGKRSDSTGRFLSLPGAVVAKKTIIAAECLSGQAYKDGWSPDECSLRLVFDNGDLDWDDDHYIGGTMKWDGNVSTGFHGAFPIGEVFDSLGIELEIEDTVIEAPDGSGSMPIAIIPDEALQALVGREVLQLQYDVRWNPDKNRMTRYSFKRLDAVGAIAADETFDEAATRLYDLFVYQASKGYPKDWRGTHGAPGKEGDDQPTGDGAPQRSLTPADPFAGADAGEYDFAPDDPLPF